MLHGRRPTDAYGAEVMTRLSEGTGEELSRDPSARVRLVVAARPDLTHSRVLVWAPQPVVIADIFRLENGKIVEHGDVQTEVAAADSVNGNSTV